MLVSHVMSSPARTCRGNTQLGQAAEMMVAQNCGCLPVVDERGALIGLITDRDISRTVAYRHQSPWQLSVRDAMTKAVVSCGPDDPIESALAVFGEVGVRRLPVVDIAGHVRGVLSIDDLVLRAGQGLPEESVFKTLKIICGAETGKALQR